MLNERNDSGGLSIAEGLKLQDERCANGYTYTDEQAGKIGD
jgi:hypothetical protein